MKIGFITAIACLLLLPCAHARDRGNGSAAGGTSRNAAPELEHCVRTLGTLTVAEDQEGDWYHYLTGDLRLGSTIPVIRLLVQQSNCFVLVERGRAMGNMLQERALMQAGELRKGNNLGKGQIVAADYTLNPSINFAESNAGGIGAVLGAFGGKAAIAGALVSGLRFKKAATILTLIDNRSGVQLAASEGQGRKTDFGLGLLGGSGGVGGLGGYSKHARRPRHRHGLRRCVQPHGAVAARVPRAGNRRRPRQRRHVEGRTMNAGASWPRTRHDASSDCRMRNPSCVRVSVFTNQCCVARWNMVAVVRTNFGWPARLRITCT